LPVWAETLTLPRTFCSYVQLFSRYADETALDAPATKAQDIFKLKTHWWSKNKIAIQNRTANPVTFHVVSVPDRVLKKLGLGLGVSATGVDIKFELERELSPALRDEAVEAIVPGETNVFYLVSDSSYAIASTDNYVKRVPAKKLWVNSG